MNSALEPHTAEEPLDLDTFKTGAVVLSAHTRARLHHILLMTAAIERYDGEDAALEYIDEAKEELFATIGLT